MEARYKTLKELKAAIKNKGIIAEWFLKIDSEGITVKELIEVRGKQEFGDTLFYAKDLSDLLKKLF